MTQLNSKLSHSWAQPTEQKDVQYVDAVAHGIGKFEGRTLTIQVVRALTEPAFWKKLGHHGQVSLSLPLDGAASVLKAAIQLKVKNIPEMLRPSLTLVLDGTDLPGLSLEAVVAEFNKIYGKWVDAQGFEAVWIVGPWPSMIKLLCHTSGQ